MGEKTNIEWTHHTWNPWRGCQHASLPDGSSHPGCTNCYAEAMSKRNPGSLGTWGADGMRVVGAPLYWDLPSYQINCQLVIVLRYQERSNGWEMFVPPSDKNSIAATLDGAAQILGVLGCRGLIEEPGGAT